MLNKCEGQHEICAVSIHVMRILLEINLIKLLFVIDVVRELLQMRAVTEIMGKRVFALKYVQ